MKTLTSNEVLLLNCQANSMCLHLVNVYHVEGMGPQCIEVRRCADSESRHVRGLIGRKLNMPVIVWGSYDHRDYGHGQLCIDPGKIEAESLFVMGDDIFWSDDEFHAYRDRPIHATMIPPGAIVRDLRKSFFSSSPWQEGSLPQMYSILSEGENDEGVSELLGDFSFEYGRSTPRIAMVIKLAIAAFDAGQYNVYRSAWAIAAAQALRERRFEDVVIVGNKTVSISGIDALGEKYAVELPYVELSATGYVRRMLEEYRVHIPVMNAGEYYGFLGVMRSERVAAVNLHGVDDPVGFFRNMSEEERLLVAETFITPPQLEDRGIPSENPFQNREIYAPWSIWAEENRLFMDHLKSAPRGTAVTFIGDGWPQEGVGGGGDMQNYFMLVGFSEFPERGVIPLPVLEEMVSGSVSYERDKDNDFQGESDADCSASIGLLYGGWFFVERRDRED